MFGKFFSTRDEVAPMIMRVLLGIVFLPHGAQKLFGWFGGHGFSATLNAFTDKMGMPLAVALLVIAAESFGALGLIAGLLTRLAAFGIFCVMVGAMLMVHWQHGFFMNWFGSQAGEGFEYHLLAIALALALMITGGGKASLDQLLSQRFDRG